MLMTRWSMLGGRNMKCPYCGEENTKVIDSRPAEENNASVLSAKKDLQLTRK